MSQKGWSFMGRKAGSRVGAFLAGVMMSVLLAACGTVAPAPAVPSETALSVLDVPGSVTSSATVSPGDITCDGPATVTLTLRGQTSITENPVDVMLVLDRSGSMRGTPLRNLKAAAKTFVDTIDRASDGALNGSIRGSRVGVVSFASSASLNRGLTGDANGVKGAIDSLSAGGQTAAGDGINLARAQFTGTRPKLMLVVSDGNSNRGANPGTAAANARGSGVEIFAVGFGSISRSALNSWASDPDSSHAFFAPSSAQLGQIFAGIGADIISPAATSIMVRAAVSDHFTVSGEQSGKGTVTRSSNLLTWQIAELNTETVTMTYTVTHKAALRGGAERVNSAVTYTDAQGNAVSFPELSVNVRGCPAAITLTPPTATNELGTSDTTHTVTASVTDDFGSPLRGIDVGFSILSGPNAGATGSGTTAAEGAAFTYAGKQGLTGRGTDTIRGCFVNGQGADVCDTALKNWVDTTPPVPGCQEAPNPSGENIPPANNQDGFFRLTATDAVDPNPLLFVDAGSGVVFGGFSSGTIIKYTEAPGATPQRKDKDGYVQIIGNQDMLVYAVDASGNKSGSVSCLVPPPPM